MTWLTLAIELVKVAWPGILAALGVGVVKYAHWKGTRDGERAALARRDGEEQVAKANMERDMALVPATIDPDAVRERLRAHRY